MKESGMNKRRLGKTGLMVSEIGFGGEWLERHPEEEGIQLIKYASSKGINILDCWMADPKSRNIIGEGIKDNRSEWFIQGHIGSTWKDGQYYRTRDMAYVRPAFEDLLERLRTDYIDLGMIHYVDSEKEWDRIQSSDYMEYIMELKSSGVIRHIGMSSHNPKVAIKAALSGFVEMILFSINPAFDMLPAGEDINVMFAEEYDKSLLVVTDIDEARLQRAASIYTVEDAAKNGVKLIYVNTAKTDDPVKLLKDFTDGTGYDDVFVFAPVKPVVEQGDQILGKDGCLNFFAGPTDPKFSAMFNFYNVHYSSTHIVGTSGGNTEDMVESLDLMSAKRINPAAMITHVGGIDSVIETTLNLPKIPGGKKLIYTNINMELTAISDFKEKGKTNPLFAKLAEIVEANNGLWCAEAEKYLLENADSAH
jgi:hypothetical protein